MYQSRKVIRKTFNVWRLFFRSHNKSLPGGGKFKRLKLRTELVQLVCFHYLGRVISALNSVTVRVAKSGALAPVWLFWNSLWRQNFFGAGRKILKNKSFPVLVLKNLGKILELEIWEKLSHKNAIKMAWWVIFNFMPIRKFSNCGAFDQNCGVF